MDINQFEKYHLKIEKGLDVVVADDKHSFFSFGMKIEYALKKRKRKDLSISRRRFKGDEKYFYNALLRLSYLFPATAHPLESQL